MALEVPIMPGIEREEGTAGNDHGWMKAGDGLSNIVVGLSG